MKTAITLLLFVFSVSIGISQNLRYEIRGLHTRGVSKEKLSAAKTMIDIRPVYSSATIDRYTATEISVITNGKIMKATGSNESLSAEQQSLLQTADVGSDIAVEIGYIHQNPATLIPEIHQLQFSLSVVPETEASYPGGYSALIKYLEKNAIEKINEKFPKEVRGVVIRFTVNESGKISHAQISGSSKIPEIDQLILEAIVNMPNWIPAENAEGVKVPQEFEFSVGNGC